MTTEGRQVSSAEELERAREEMRVAGQLLDLGSPRVAATRIDYACFHALRSLLYVEGLEPKTHEGAQHLFNLHFVKTGRFLATDSRLLAQLQKFREEADYNETFVADEVSTREDLAAAGRLVDRLAAALPAP